MKFGLHYPLGWGSIPLSENDYEEQDELERVTTSSSD